MPKLMESVMRGWVLTINVEIESVVGCGREFIRAFFFALANVFGNFQIKTRQRHIFFLRA